MKKIYDYIHCIPKAEGTRALVMVYNAIPPPPLPLLSSQNVVFLLSLGECMRHAALRLQQKYLFFNRRMSVVHLYNIAIIPPLSIITSYSLL